MTRNIPQSGLKEKVKNATFNTNLKPVLASFITVQILYSYNFKSVFTDFRKVVTFNYIGR